MVDNNVVDTPAKIMDAELTEQHRKLFNAQAFGIDNNGTVIDQSRYPKSESKALTRERWSVIVTTLSKWKKEDEIQNLSPEAREEYSAFKQQHLDEWKAEWNQFYRWSKLYKIEHGALATGEAVKRLLRKEETKSRLKALPSVPRLVIPMLDVFDVINDTHSRLGHLGMERTYNEIAKVYYSITQQMVSIYVKKCYHCIQKQSTIKETQGAKKQNVSHEYRDRFQIDLIDMRKMKRMNVYGVTQRWILTLKDHATGWTHLRSLPRKKAKFVAHELDLIFGLIGCPRILHSDCGKEFVAKEVLVLLKELNPNIISVTGRPRTPRDRGSVKSTNKLIKRILSGIESEMRAKGREPNWTNYLGRVMSVINNQHGRGLFAETAFKAIFGQDYQLPVRSDCFTIEERLRDNPDSCFRAVAEELCLMEGEGINEVNKEDEDRYWDDDEMSLESKESNEGDADGCCGVDEGMTRTKDILRENDSP